MADPFALVSVAEMRALEAAAIEAGTPEHELQERAGRAVADVVTERLPGSGERVVVLAGPGNNGRDGAVAARHLAERGFQVQLWAGPRHPLTPQEQERLASVGVELRTVDLSDGAVALRKALAASRVAVDALLGIGARGAMRPELAAIAEILNKIRTIHPRLLVVAVDVPSGVDADHGGVLGVAVRADLTVTFGAVKTGLLRFPAARLVGDLEPTPIGLPRAAVEHLPLRILDGVVARALIPARPIDAHKYRFGRVLVVAGSSAYVGAAYLSTAAAARSGCGLVTVASGDAVKLVMATRFPEATYPPESIDREQQPERAADQVAELLPSYQALLIGPGLGRSEPTERFLRHVLAANGQSAQPTPTVIDADALALLARWDGWWEQIGPNHVLTPHAGEMARLTRGDADDVMAVPWEPATRFAHTWQQTLILKGPFTTVASPNAATWVYPHANPALATAGTGDVLAGLCAGLVAQGVPPANAARLAVVAHARAARRVVEARGWRTLLASDLLDEIPWALRVLELAGDDRPGTLARRPAVEQRPAL